METIVFCSRARRRSGEGMRGRDAATTKWADLAAADGPRATRPRQLPGARTPTHRLAVQQQALHARDLVLLAGLEDFVDVVRNRADAVERLRRGQGRRRATRRRHLAVCVWYSSAARPCTKRVKSVRDPRGCQCFAAPGADCVLHAQIAGAHTQRSTLVPGEPSLPRRTL